MTGDRSPIISKTPVGGVFVNCGWGTGGFKAIPGSGWAMAELVAKGEPGSLRRISGWTVSGKEGSSTKASRQGWRIDKRRRPDAIGRRRAGGRGAWNAC